MTNRRRLEIVDEAYGGTNGNFLYDGFDGQQWREVSDNTGSDDAWEISAILIELDRRGKAEIRRQIAANEF